MMECLLIDDNKMITDAISLVLKTQNVASTVINESKEGLKEIRNKNYDLIFLDLAMPGMSGYDIIKELKDAGEIESKNIVIVTASSKSDDDIEKLIDAGAKSVLRKPITIVDIKEVINKYRPK